MAPPIEAERLGGAYRISFILGCVHATLLQSDLWELNETQLLYAPLSVAPSLYIYHQVPTHQKINKALYYLILNLLCYITPCFKVSYLIILISDKIIIVD